MIATIGSLVQEVSKRRWLIAVSLYIIACVGSSVLLGILLSLVGHFIHIIDCWDFFCTSLPIKASVFIGLLSLLYGLGDSGIIRLPYPRFMYAVPVTWWRHWRPYGAAISYGAALGLGMMTRVQFGAFYVLALLCIIRGDMVYGGLLMGTFGVSRALIMFPASREVYRCQENCDIRLRKILGFRGLATTLEVSVLVLFSALMLTATFLLPG